MIPAALPAGVLAFVLAQQVDITLQRPRLKCRAAAIVVSTVVSLMTLSPLFVVLGVG